MFCRQLWMSKIVGWITLHSEPLHDGTRSEIGCRSEGHDFREIELAEAVMDHELGCLGRVSKPPVVKGEAPADFDAGREAGVEARDRQAAEPDEGNSAWHLNSPKPEMMILEVPLNSLDHCIALAAAQRRSKELHHAYVGVHSRKRLAILGTPRAQTDTMTDESNGGAHIDRTISCGRLRLKVSSTLP